MKKLLLAFGVIVIAVCGYTESIPVDNSAPLSLVKFVKKNRAPDYEVQRYRKDVSLTLSVKNNTKNTVTAWRLKMTVKDAFGDIILTSKLTSGDSHIAPGSVEDAFFTWEDNQFVENEPYDNLVSVSQENMKISFSEITVVSK